MRGVESGFAIAAPPAGGPLTLMDSRGRGPRLPANSTMHRWTVCRYIAIAPFTGRPGAAGAAASRVARTAEFVGTGTLADGCGQMRVELTVTRHERQDRRRKNQRSRTRGCVRRGQAPVRGHHFDAHRPAANGLAARCRPYRHAWHGTGKRRIKPSIDYRRYAMKFETALLHGLFVACLVSCVFALVSMVRAQPAPAQLAAEPVPVAAAHTLG